MRHLGIDYGGKRVGIALSDDGGVMAFPHSVIQNSKNLVSTIAQLCDDEAVTLVVIGESKDLKGGRNPIMDAIDTFVAEWKETSAIPIVLEPEFLTSQQAAHIQGRNDTLDASAAAIILQSYLDKKRNNCM